MGGDGGGQQETGGGDGEGEVRDTGDQVPGGGHLQQGIVIPSNLNTEYKIFCKIGFLLDSHEMGI